MNTYIANLKINGEDNKFSVKIDLYGGAIDGGLDFTTHVFQICRNTGKILNRDIENYREGLAVKKIQGSKDIMGYIRSRLFRNMGKSF